MVDYQAAPSVNRMALLCLAHPWRHVIFMRVLFKWRWTMAIMLVLYLVNSFSPFGEDKPIVLISSSREFETHQKKANQSNLIKKFPGLLNRTPAKLPNLLSQRIVPSGSLSLQGWWMSHVKWDVSQLKRRLPLKPRQVFSVACSPYRIVETYQHLRLNTNLKSIRGVLFKVSSTNWEMRPPRRGIMKKFPPFYGAQLHVALTSGKTQILKFEFEAGSGKVRSQKVEYLIKKGERIRTVTVMLGCFGFEGFVAFTDLSVEPIFDKKFTHNSPTTSDLLDSCPPPLHAKQPATPLLNTTLEVFYSSYSPKDKSSITLVTQLTFGRIYMLKMNLKFWHGPISVVIYVACEKGETISAKREEVERRAPLYMFSKFSTASVIIVYGGETGEKYPINSLRNMAIKHSKTQYLFLVDADFVPSPHLHETARNHIMEYTRKKREGSQTAFVVPAFEELKEFGANLDSSELPKTKNDLLEIIEEGIKLSPFRQVDSPLSHSSTDYSRWYRSSAPYEIRNYQDKYEPYLILRRNPEMPLYDERFTGYGMNKISHVIELSLLRYTFVVLPNVWIIHRHHRISPLSWVHRMDPDRRFANRLQRFEFISDLHSKYKLAGCR